MARKGQLKDLSYFEGIVQHWELRWFPVVKGLKTDEVRLELMKWVPTGRRPSEPLITKGPRKPHLVPVKDARNKPFRLELEQQQQQQDMAVDPHAMEHPDQPMHMQGEYPMQGDPHMQPGMQHGGPGGMPMSGDGMPAGHMMPPGGLVGGHPMGPGGQFPLGMH